MAAPIIFELEMTEPNKVIPFYANTFHWDITKFEGIEEYWKINTSDNSYLGFNGAIFSSKSPFNGFINTIEVNIRT